MKKTLFIVLFLFSMVFVPNAFAGNSFVSIVNPIRGNDFWDLKDQKPETALLGQISILEKHKLSTTWLIRFDALENEKIVDELVNRVEDEKGLFLEVTPSWADNAKIEYRKSTIWHAAGSAFLTGYERNEREKLIDTAFVKFKSIFGYFPSSVGAWWIDSYSLGYMQEQYGITSALIVSDQYSTDNYQIWGQYFGTPYYPNKNNALHPAQTLENKLPIVILQWAPRDPVNAYGSGVYESTHSVQANDYMDYHKLDNTYFSKLLDIYTKQQFNQFSHVVIGLENSYPWGKYRDEYNKQIEILAGRQNSNQLKIVLQKDFASWYKKIFPQLSPEHLIIADDPLGSYKKSVWFMNPFYRAGWFLNEDGSVFRDIRQYIEGEEELCFWRSCSSVNFATFATRVLDDVTYGSKWVIDKGRIRDFSVSKEPDGYLISYINEAGNLRRIEFLARDIKIDEKISTIDGAILNVIKEDGNLIQNEKVETGSFSWSIVSVFSKSVKFILFWVLAVFIPGFVFLDKKMSCPEKLFLSGAIGFVLLTVVFYMISLLNIRFLIFLYISASFLLFLKLRPFHELKFRFSNLKKIHLIAFLIIILGTIFQTIPTLKSGLTFPYGLGFWGPNTHDGIWHISLINELVKNVPAQNPIFANTILINYHYFYDLTVAATHFLTKIPNFDLVFRFYPIVFSLLLGIGSYLLAQKLFKNNLSAVLGLYLVYFSGSFGWIVDFLKNKSFGGESAFWANQSISFNLNPPLAISIIVLIAFLLLIKNIPTKNFKQGIFISALLLGCLMGFKSYGAVLAIGSLAIVSIVNLLKREFVYLYICVISTVLSLVIFISGFDIGQKLIVFSPFWFIHSMIDSPDRVGWARLSLARISGWETGNWFKFFSSEIISLFIFICGNLGIRLLSLASLINIKTFLKDNLLLFIFIFSILSFLIPILFIQSGNPWNTIQFSYFGLYMTAIVSGSVVAYLISRMPKLISFLFLLGVIILAPINSITTASYYTGSQPHALVSHKEIQALEFLSELEEGIVLTFPYDKKFKNKLLQPWPLFIYDSTAYVSALSKKSVYLEDESQNAILLTDYKKRLVASKDFFLKSSPEAKFLKENNIKYIYLPKIYNIRLDESSKVVKNIFENEEVKIYQRI